MLDDAVLISGPTSSHPALNVSGLVGDGRFPITGTLAPGQTVTVTYKVRMNPMAGVDNDLGNFLVDPGEEPPASCKAISAGQG